MGEMPGYEAEDDSTSVNALVSADEWMLECGRVACRATLADVAWVDINFNMAANGAEALNGALSLSDLPAPQFRRYRLAVMFPFDWRWSENGNLWLSENAAAASRPKAGYSERVVRGGWNAAVLGQMGTPPFFTRCPACDTIQTVGSHRRKGTPAPGKAVSEAEPAAPPQSNRDLRSPVKQWPSAQSHQLLRRYQ
jgi:hypothetical protein